MSGAAITVLVIGALLVGFSKTAIAGVSTVSIVLYAAVLPVRQSTGVLLVLLMVGDALAIASYRRHADWATLHRLIVPVAVGIVLGAVFLVLAPTAWLKPVIGAIVVGMTLLQFWRQRQTRSAGGAGHGSTGHGGQVANFFGSLAGFTTMVANAGGPVMSLYLLRSKLDVTRFVGTTAWFFACVNLAKLPVSLGLGLIRPSRLPLCLALVPAVVVGAIVGRWAITRISQVLFERIVLVVAGLSGLYLMLT